MILFLYVVLNVVCLFFFIIKKKKLHILEIIMYWMVGSYLFQNYSALCYMNFKTIMIPDKLSFELTHFLNRMVLYPMFMVAFLNFFLIISTYLKKFLLIISFIFLFVGLEWLEDFLGIFNHVHWQIWWSFTFWLTGLVVLIGFMKFFRKYLYRGELD
jgi:hypothetical protein